MAATAPLPVVDTHAHVDYIVREGTDTAQAVLDRAKAAGLQWMINPSVDLNKLPDVLKLIDTHEHVYAAVAVHPTDVQLVEEPDWANKIREALQHPKVLAVGETGLDYYWDKQYQPIQQTFLETFYEMADEFNLPIILHCRDKDPDTDQSPWVYPALEDIITTAKRYPNVTGVMHCFAGNAEYAERLLELGYWISFAGNLTFKKATILHEAATAIPLDRLLIETDSPFLSPIPHRGKPNEPCRVVHVAEKIAELKGITPLEVAEATTRNAVACFKPPHLAGA